MGMFEPSDGVFKDPSVLREDHEPEEILGRNDEIENYKRALQPVMDNGRLKSIFLYGPTGVGKTAITTYLLRHLVEDAAEYNIDVNFVRETCGNTSYQTAANIINKIRPTHNQISETGYASARMYRELYDELDSFADDNVIVVLDEVDNLSTDDRILYELPRAKSNDRLDTDILVIGISNDLRFKDKISNKVQSSLAQRELHFPPYDANELRKILRARAEKAFYDGVLADDVVPLCAALAAQDDGDARQGLDLLELAGEKANADGCDMVVEEHVERAEDELNKSVVSDGLSDLTTQAELVLCALCVHRANGDTPVRSKEVYQAYQHFAEKADVRVVSKRQVRKHLTSLQESGFISSSERNTGRQSGRFRVYSVDTAVETIFEELDEDPRIGEIVKIVREKMDVPV